MSAPQNNEPQAPAPIPPIVVDTAVRTAHATSIIALVLGIISCLALFCFPPLSALLGIAALILGFLGFIKANERPAQFSGKGMAIAGIVMGALSCVLCLLFIGLFAIPNFSDLRSRAYKASATSAGRNARLAEEIYFQDGGGDQGPGYTNKLTNLLKVDPNLANDPNVQWSFGECNTQGYTFTVWHEKTGEQQVMTK